MQKKSVSFEDALMVILSILIILMLIFLFNFKLSVAEGKSMSPTIKEGQLALEYKNFKEIKRYDIVSIENASERSKKGNTKLGKRVIGLPGDTIEVVKGHVYVNGELDLYDVPGTENVIAYQDSFTLVLGEDEYFVCGDNRLNSNDNRLRSFGGPVKLSEIKAVIILY